MQHAKSSTKTILSKIFEQNVDYAEVDQFFTTSFNNDDISKKIMTSSKKVMSNVRWIEGLDTHAKFYCKTKSRSKVTEGGPNLPLPSSQVPPRSLVGIELIIYCLLGKEISSLFWRLKKCQSYLWLSLLAFQTYFKESLNLNDQLLIY